MKALNLCTLLIASLFVTAAFMPMVSATAAGDETEIRGLANSLQVTRVSDTGPVTEFVVASTTSKMDTQRYRIKRYVTAINGKEIVKAEVVALGADWGRAAEQEIFGKDSYVSRRGSAWAIHIGSIDIGFIKNGGSLATGAFASWLAGALGVTGGTAAVLAVALGGVFIIGTYAFSNKDSSMDLEISDIALEALPLAVAMPGPQPIPITIKGSLQILMI